MDKYCDFMVAYIQNIGDKSLRRNKHSAAIFGKSSGWWFFTAVIRQGTSYTYVTNSSYTHSVVHHIHCACEFCLVTEYFQRIVLNVFSFRNIIVVSHEPDLYNWKYTQRIAWTMFSRITAWAMLPTILLPGIQLCLLFRASVGTYILLLLFNTFILT